MNNHLVILGGMGPQASIRLHELLIQKSLQFHNGNPDNFPEILHASMKVPDFINTPTSIQDAITAITCVCDALPLKSAAAIGLACNTAHMLENRLPLQGVNFVSMIDAVVSEVVKLHIESVCVIGSPNTIRSQLFQSPLENSGMRVILPDDAELAMLDTLIHSVIAGHNGAREKAALAEVANTALMRGADAIVLGCTELPLIGLTTRVPVIDSLSVLANAMLDKMYSEQV